MVTGPAAETGLRGQGAPGSSVRGGGVVLGLACPAQQGPGRLGRKAAPEHYAPSFSRCTSNRMPGAERAV